MEGDKGIRIGIANQAKHLHLLTLMNNGNHHLQLVVREATFCKEKSGSVTSLCADGLYKQIMTLGVDGKLNVLLGGVYHGVHGKGIDYQGYITEDNHLPTLEEEIATSDDKKVEIEQHTTYADILVLVDDRGYDIPSTGATATHEYHAYANTIEYGTKNTRHTFLVVTEHAP